MKAQVKIAEQFFAQKLFNNLTADARERKITHSVYSTSLNNMKKSTDNSLTISAQKLSD
jgi:hypothetical protein